MAIYSPQPNSLEQLLRSRRYTVPIYQRPFTWTKDEASELWYDIDKNNPPYFLGILVLQKTQDGKTFGVVDGQQRLATVLLLIRSVVEILGVDDDAKRLQNEYINQKKIGEKASEFVLTLSERDKYNFSSLLDETTYLPPQLSPKERRGRQRPASPVKLKSVKDFFREKLTSLMSEKGREGVLSFVTQKVLALTFIEVQLEDDNDVFLFFETLNARGIDLTIADLLKNRVCSVSLDKSGSAKRIDEISDMVGEGKMNSFLLHYCSALSTEKSPPTKKSLMSWYNKIIEKEKDDFLISLKDYAEIYSLFLEPKKSRSQELREVLNNLKVLGATRCYPLLLVGYKFLTPGEFLRLCKAVETLTFRHSTIAGRDAKTLEDKYYELSQRIKNKNKLSPILEKLNDLARQVSDEVFETNFKEYEPANNQVAKYILLKIDNLLNKGSIKLDWDDVTLEHVLAGGADWDGKEDLLERLGNMILLSGILNKSLGNKVFKTKKKEYKKENRVKLTQELANYDDFTKESIVKRQNNLVELGGKLWSPNL